MKRTWLGAAVAVLAGGLSSAPTSATAGTPSATGRDPLIGVNVVLTTEISDRILADLGTHGRVRDTIPEINAVTVQARTSELRAIRGLAYVAAAGPDVEGAGAPVDTVTADSFTDGVSTWDLDAVDITETGVGRIQNLDGDGVYVAVLDTGLVDSWRQYFPDERVANQYGISFGGGGGELGTVSTQPNKWEHDQNSHGTNVTSTILGWLGRPSGRMYNGVAPMATVIPVKVINQSGVSWSSVIARGIVYVANLKRGALAGSPVVINMSIGYSEPDPVLLAAIDYALKQGVVVVAAAGNRGDRGMLYPAAYPPVISVAASGWIGQWQPGADGNITNFVYSDDVPDPTKATDFFIPEWSSRALYGQDLDVAAPGVWTVGPYQLNSGQLRYAFISGTSMASPHVAGIAALMLQKNPGLKASDIENTLQTSAIAMDPGCRDVVELLPPPADAFAIVPPSPVCWAAGAAGSGLVGATLALALTSEP